MITVIEAKSRQQANYVGLSLHRREEKKKRKKEEKKKREREREIKEEK
jgi:hypothetical protein